MPFLNVPPGYRILPKPVLTNTGVRCVVAESSMSGAGLGLFSIQHIAQGAIIGFYTGDILQKNSLNGPDSPDIDARNAYAINVYNSRLVVSPPIDDAYGRPNPVKYPLAMANEANNDGGSNNAEVLTMKLDRDDPQIADFVPKYRIPEKQGVFILPMFATSDIRPGDEILWYYGPSYNAYRNYTPGKKTILSESMVPYSKIIRRYSLPANVIIHSYKRRDAAAVPLQVRQNVQRRLPKRNSRFSGHYDELD